MDEGGAGRARVLTVSDGVVAGTREDRSGHALADRLAAGPFVPDEGWNGPGELALQPAVGALLGLGVRELDVEFEDGSAAPAFYYARVFQVDGELAWSSPIWVRPPVDGPANR